MPRSAMVFLGLFSRGAALAAMVIATERLVYAILSAEQEEAFMLHILSGQDVFNRLSSNQGWEVPVLPHFTYVFTFFVAVVSILAS